MYTTLQGGRDIMYLFKKHHDNFNNYFLLNLFSLNVLNLNSYKFEIFIYHAVIIKSTINPSIKSVSLVNLQLMSLSFVLGNMSNSRISALFCSFSWIIVTGVNQFKKKKKLSLIFYNVITLQAGF